MTTVPLIIIGLDCIALGFSLCGLWSMSQWSRSRRKRRDDSA